LFSAQKSFCDKKPPEKDAIKTWFVYLSYLPTVFDGCAKVMESYEQAESQQQLHQSNVDFIHR
jgi:hypothetical protein